MNKTFATAIYVRISSDPSGTRLGVTRQLEECRAKALSLGWQPTHVYEDNDVSASGSRPRPAYRRMLADLENGVVNAVVVWDLDRLTRRPAEIEEFIDLADRRGVALASVGGDVDLSTDNGRLFARIKGAVARAEIERKSARQKSANEQRAAAGRPHAGRRCFGYNADGMELDEEEAREVRLAIQAFLRGASVRAIAREMSERGARTTAGGPWRPTEVRRMLSNPRYAGIRLHRGQAVAEGNWPRLVSVEQHETVLAILASPDRHKAGPPTRHLLSGVAACGVCGGRIFGVTDRKKGVLYFCETRRHVSRQAAPIDELVCDAVLLVLSSPETLDRLAPLDLDGDRAELRLKERAARRRLDELAEAFAAGEIDRSQLRAATARLRKDLDETVEAMAATVRAPVVRDLLRHVDIIRAWSDLDTERRREVIDCLLCVTIQPAGRGSRSFDPTTIDISPRTGERIPA